VGIGWKNLPAGVEACELLLDIDGGRARLRITDELDPGTVLEAVSWGGAGTDKIRPR